MPAADDPSKTNGGLFLLAAWMILSQVFSCETRKKVDAQSATLREMEARVIELNKPK